MLALNIGLGTPGHRTSKWRHEASLVVAALADRIPQPATVCFNGAVSHGYCVRYTRHIRGDSMADHKISTIEERSVT